MENLSRVLPPGLELAIDWKSWQRPAIFDWLQEVGQVDEAEMARVFNLGIGMVLVVNDYFAGSICEMIASTGATCQLIGRVATK